MADENTPQEAQNRPQDVPADNSGIGIPPENESAQGGTEDAESSDESFTREYVESLRAEAKGYREKAQRVDALTDAVRGYAIKEAATSAGLIDPEALVWSEDFEGEDGLPDHDQLLAAAQALARSKPWLVRPRGPLPGQGEHGSADEGLSLSALLRA